MLPHPVVGDRQQDLPDHASQVLASMRKQKQNLCREEDKRVMKLSLLPFSNSTTTLGRVLSWDKSTTVITDKTPLSYMPQTYDQITARPLPHNIALPLMPYCFEDADDDTISFFISIAELINQINAQNLHSLVLRKSILINYGFSSPQIPEVLKMNAAISIGLR